MSRRDRVSHFIDAILGDRRPPRFDATPDEAEILRAATALRGARPGADLPREEFVASLEARLRAAAKAPPAPSRKPLVDRRGFLRGAGLAAAAATVGVVADRAAGSIRGDGGDVVPPQAELVPREAAWRQVATVAGVRAAGAVRFTAGPMVGYVIARGDSIDAVSAICTHMGCTLNFNRGGGRLDCPCHGASFALDGAPLHRGYVTPLPTIRSRINGDNVEVLA